METGTVDVVWREFRSSQDLKDLERYNNGSGLDNLNYSNYYTRTSDKENALLLSKYKNGRIPSPVLRRERFEFDDIFAGVSAPGRMSLYVRQRTRKALEYARGLTLLCLGCGYIPSGQLEPPLALLLGNGGGTGLIHSAVEEIFRYIHPSVTYTTEQVRHGSFATGADRMRDTSPQYMSAAGNSAMRSLAVKVAYEQMNTKVVLTAVIITEDGMIIDLLSKSGVKEQEQSGPILRKRKSDRTPVLCNVSRLELKSAMDFDRVSGMLLGKRATIESMRAARLKEAEYGGNFLVARKRNGVSDGEGSTSRFSALHPWVQVDGLADEPLSRSPGRLRGQLSGIGDSGVTETSGQQAATMLFTISVSGGGISKGLNVADFHFVSPCGSCWHTPGELSTVLFKPIDANKWPMQYLFPTHADGH